MTDAEKLKSMKREEIQALAKELGVSAGGKTEEIIARIQAAEAAAAPEEAAGQDAAAEAAEEQAAAPEEAAELVTVKTIERFFDVQLNQIKEEGEAYQVKKERAAELVAAGVAKIEK